MEKEPKLIKTWEELKEVTSKTHFLEIDIEGGNGWIREKYNNDDSFMSDHYLSTHTFYEKNYIGSTKLLQECGFNVRLANWDE